MGLAGPWPAVEQDAAFEVLAVFVEGVPVLGDPYGVVRHLPEQAVRQDDIGRGKGRPGVKGHPGRARTVLAHHQGNNLSLEYAAVPHPPAELREEACGLFCCAGQNFKGR